MQAPDSNEKGSCNEESLLMDAGPERSSLNAKEASKCSSRGHATKAKRMHAIHASSLAASALAVHSMHCCSDHAQVPAMPF